MATPVFPDSLPGVSSLSWEPSNQVQATEGEGPLAVHRTTRDPGANGSVSWRFLEGDFAIFQEFYKTDLIRGHKWFILTLPCAGGFLPHIVRIKKHRSASRDGYGYRTVSAEIQVRERRFRPSIAITHLTTPLYPLYETDGLDPSLTLLSGFFGALHLYAYDEGLDPSLVLLSGTLETLLKTYDAGHEDLDTSLTLLSGVLETLLKTYDASHEDLDVICTLLSGTLEAKLIVYDMGVEGIDSSLTLLSGTLA